LVGGLVKLANHLDQKGLRKEADLLDHIIRKMAMDDEAKPKRVSYSAVVLDNESADALKAAAEDFVPEGFVYSTNAGEPLPHHMTIKMGPLKDEYSEHYTVGDEVSLTVTHIGVSADAVAAQVVAPGPVKNKIPHITIAIPPGGKPFMSNKIPSEAFQEIGPINVTGIVEEVPQKG
jgi:hypothetical protein